MINRKSLHDSLSHSYRIRDTQIAPFRHLFIFIYFIYLTTVKHNYRLHQANISMKKNHNLHEQRQKALTCKAMDNTSSCISYYIQLYRIKKKEKIKRH